MLANYCDVDVYERDAVLFQDGQWLNDTCINLRFKRMEQLYGDPTVLLLDPSVVSFVRFQMGDDDEIAELSDGNDIPRKAWIIFPLNDSASLTSASTHWSILLCHTLSGQLFHFDSSKGYNTTAARSFSPIVSLLIDRTCSDVKAVDVPQQQNGYDCGVYSIMFAKCIVEALSVNSSVDPLLLVDQVSHTLCSTLTPSVVTEYRKICRDDLEILASEYAAKKLSK